MILANNSIVYAENEQNVAILLTVKGNLNNIQKQTNHHN